MKNLLIILALVFASCSSELDERYKVIVFENATQEQVDTIHCIYLLNGTTSTKRYDMLYELQESVNKRHEFLFKYDYVTRLQINDEMYTFASKDSLVIDFQNIQ